MKGKINCERRVRTIGRSIPRQNRWGRICAVLVMLILLLPFVHVLLFNETYQDNEPQIQDKKDEMDGNLVAVPDNTLSFSAEEALKPRTVLKITGTRGYIGTSPPVGDWVISGEAIVWNETITLNGDLTITETGNLTLINVTLIVNCSYNGEYH
ncbi:MAG: hypothetical protein JSW28_00240, partial [Thermoplasmata archaeon]